MTVLDRPSTAPAAAPAPLGSRLAAYLLDWLVTFILTCVFISAAGLLLLVASDMGRTDPPDRALYTALLVAGMVVPVWTLVTLAGWSWHGQSVGKLAMNLRVVSRGGTTPGLGRAVVRLVVYTAEHLALVLAPLSGAAAWWLRSREVPLPLLFAPAAALVLPVVSVALLLTDQQRRALHDRLAGTWVIAE